MGKRKVAGKAHEYMTHVLPILIPPPSHFMPTLLLAGIAVFSFYHTHPCCRLQLAEAERCTTLKSPPPPPALMLHPCPPLPLLAHTSPSAATGSVAGAALLPCSCNSFVTSSSSCSCPGVFSLACLPLPSLCLSNRAMRAGQAARVTGHFIFCTVRGGGVLPLGVTSARRLSALPLEPGGLHMPPPFHRTCFGVRSPCRITASTQRSSSAGFSDPWGRNVE